MLVTFWKESVCFQTVTIQLLGEEHALSHLVLSVYVPHITYFIIFSSLQPRRLPSTIFSQLKLILPPPESLFCYKVFTAPTFVSYLKTHLDHRFSSLENVFICRQANTRIAPTPVENCIRLSKNPRTELLIKHDFNI